MKKILSFTLATCMLLSTLTIQGLAVEPKETLKQFNLMEDNGVWIEAAKGDAAIQVEENTRLETEPNSTYYTDNYKNPYPKAYERRDGITWFEEVDAAIPMKNEKGQNIQVDFVIDYDSINYPDNWPFNP